LFFSLTRDITGGRVALAALLLLVFSPGFSEAWLRLLVPERGSLVFFIGFLWCYFRYEDRGHLAYATGALIAANVAMYYKEPGFIMLGTFAVVRLLSARLSKSDSTRIVDELLIVSVALSAA